MTQTLQVSAKIYQFPVGGQSALRNREQQPEIRPQQPAVAIDGWYHDEAIRESNRGSEH